MTYVQPVSMAAMKLIASNQIFHHIRCITPKHVTNLRGPSPRHCARKLESLFPNWNNCNCNHILFTKLTWLETMKRPFGRRVKLPPAQLLTQS